MMAAFRVVPEMAAAAAVAAAAAANGFVANVFI